MYIYIYIHNTYYVLSTVMDSKSHLACDVMCIMCGALVHGYISTYDVNELTCCASAMTACCQFSSFALSVAASASLLDRAGTGTSAHSMDSGMHA